MYKRLNPLKRKIFKSITSSYRNRNVPFCSSNFIQNKKVSVLITRPNHRLGNQLLLSPLIQEIYNQIPNCEIDLLVNGSLSRILYQNYAYVNTVHDLPKKPFKNLSRYLKISFRIIKKKYDIGVSGCENSNSGKIFLKLSRCKHKIFDCHNLKANKPQHIAKYPVYNFMINQKSIEGECINYPKIDLKLSEQEILKAKQVLHDILPNKKKIIAIFTYATGNKKLSKQWWQTVYSGLKNEFTDYSILEILPKENVSQINFESTHYYSKDLREIAAVIENCSLFIGADSGMMHLAVSTNTPVFGLFKITKPEIYQPYGKNNRSIIVDEFSKDKIINEAKKLNL